MVQRGPSRNPCQHPILMLIAPYEPELACLLFCHHDTPGGGYDTLCFAVDVVAVAHEDAWAIWLSEIEGLEQIDDASVDALDLICDVAHGVLGSVRDQHITQYIWWSRGWIGFALGPEFPHALGVHSLAVGGALVLGDAYGADGGDLEPGALFSGQADLPAEFV